MNKIIAIVIVVIAVVAAAFYFMGGKTPVSLSGTSQTASVAEASSSDEISDIEADLNVTDPGPDLSGLN